MLSYSCKLISTCDSNDHSQQYVVLKKKCKSMKWQDFPIYIHFFGHHSTETDKLRGTLHESWGFSWFSGICQSLGGFCLNFHTGVNFLCSSTLFLSLICRASCKKRKYELILYSIHFFFRYCVFIGHSDILGFRKITSLDL